MSGAACAREKQAIFWDFDGVIKDSVEVKSEAFRAIFEPYGAAQVKRILSHHEAHGGVSRFEKFPVYLQWVGLTPTEDLVAEFCERFSLSVLDAVVASPWVPGVYEYLQENYRQQKFYLVTATPQSEIETIVERLKIRDCFIQVFGAPTRKADAMKTVLAENAIAPQDAMMIGDSEADFKAAQRAGIDFLLRKTTINGPLQAQFQGPQFEHFSP